MSSLGDLLMGKIPEPEDIAIKEDSGREEEEDKRRNRDEHANDQQRHRDIQASQFGRSPSSNASEDASNSQHAAGGVQKIIPDRIEKVKIDDDRRSNASSTDDLVRELLDPNDRPRNVWHVVAEGTQESPKQDSDHNEGASPKSRDEKSESPARNGDRVEEDQDRNLEADDDRHRETDNQDASRHRESSATEEDRTKGERRTRDKTPDKDERAPKEDRDRRRDRDRSREHDRDRDRRRRSPDRHSKSRSKRSRHSDDEDDDRDYKRHRSSQSRRHDRRSRSPSRDSGSRRRRHRSRSNESRSSSSKRDSRTILVMQLSARVVERDLEEHFEDIGRVKEVRLIMDSATRRHKGIAYIEFESASSVAKALTRNGQRFMGVPMQIQSAATERSRSGADAHGGLASSSSSSFPSTHNSHHQISTSHTSSSHYTSSRSHFPPNSYRVYMGGLNVGITEDMLRTIVEPFGLVYKVEIIKDRTTGLSRGYAFVTFASPEDGQEAIRNLDGFELAGKSLRVSKSTEKSEH